MIGNGKLRVQRAKSMKFKDGYMISSGQPVNEYIYSAVRHVLLRQVFDMQIFLFVNILIQPVKGYNLLLSLQICTDYVLI